MEIYSLGSVIFDDIVEKELYLEEEFLWCPVGYSSRHSLGQSIVFQENLRVGKPLTIIASEDRAWLTRATVIELHQLASLVNTTHTLSMKNEQGTLENRIVRFKRNEGPLNLQPLDTSQRYYVGSIHLIEA
jgi:hypothetical protein